MLVDLGLCRCSPQHPVLLPSQPNPSGMLHHFHARPVHAALCEQLLKTKALLNVGEIKSSSNGCSKGLDQLQSRHYFLEWSVRHLRDSVTDIMRVGHVFMPYNEASLDNAQVSDDVNTCIHVHFL